MIGSRATQSLLAPFVRRRPASVTAVDFDGHVVRIAQARGGKRPRLDHLAIADLPDELDHGDAEACGKWLGETLAKLNIRTSSGVVMGIPRRQVMLKPLTLPMPEDPTELAGMVHFQVGKELPFPAEEAVVDFTIHGYSEPAAESEEKTDTKSGDEEGQSEQPAATVEVLAAITRRSVVEHYRQKAEAADLKLVGVGLRSYANVRAVEACGVDNRQQAVALVSLRPDEVIIDILVESRLAFSRIAAANLQGHHHDADAQSAASHHPEEQVDLSKPDEKALIAAVTKEVVRSLHGYRAHPDHREIGRVVVSGDTGPEQAVADALAERLGMPCQQINPAADLDYQGEAAEHASAAIAAIGLAIGATDRQGLPFDFLNPKRPVVRRDTRPLKAAAVVAALILSVAFIGYQHVVQTGEREQTLANLREEIEKIGEQRRDFQRIQRNRDNVLAWDASRRRWLDHYLYLSAILPPSEDVYVSNFSTTSRGHISLTLHARSGSILTELDRKLREAGYTVVTPLGITPGTDSHGYHFRTNVEIAIPEDFEFGDGLENLTVPPRPEDDQFRLQTAIPLIFPEEGHASADGGRRHE